jgi:hypothetical protein
MEEMKQRKHEFRSFYKNVIDMIIEEEANIKRFLQRERRVPAYSSKVNGKGKSKRKSRRIQHILLA